MELFDNEGHLRDEALQALAAETLDEMSLLEVSEHLSFCDVCLNRYTELLTDDLLMEPLTPVKPAVMRRLQRKNMPPIVLRYVGVAAAAVLAVGLWRGGMFAYTHGRQWQGAAAAGAVQRCELPVMEQDDTVMDKINRGLSDATAGMRRFMSGFMPTAKLDEAGDAKRGGRDGHGRSGADAPDGQPETDQSSEKDGNNGK